jgi:hypothetical protein
LIDPELIFAPRFGVFDEISWILLISVEKRSILLELVQRFRRKVNPESSKNEKKFIDEQKLIEDLHEIVKWLKIILKENLIASWDK